MTSPGPVRTCVGCGGRAPQRELRRFVAGRPGLRLDRTGRAPGRGAYLHARAECWQTFVRRRGPVRSLRCSPTIAERAALVAILSAAAEGEQG